MTYTTAQKAQCFQWLYVPHHGFDSRHPLQFIGNPVVLEITGFFLYINVLRRFTRTNTAEAKNASAVLHIKS